MEFVQNDGKSFLLKNRLFNLENISQIAKNIHNVYPDFKTQQFIDTIFKNFEELELKQRITKITKTLYEFLPKNYEKSIEILIKSLPTEFEEDRYIYAPYLEFVSTYGLQKDKLEISFNALSIFTKYFSAEFAIRDFINIFQKETLEFLENMSKKDNFKQQRLASEGLRPKLPWAKKIQIDYKIAAKFLDNLYYNKNRVVTRSVANHLHDISKIDKYFVLDKLNQFKAENKQNTEELNYIIKHSLRTLIKRGDLDVMSFLGFSTKINEFIENFNFKINKNQIKIGETLEFEINFTSKLNKNIILDYIVFYPNLKGVKKSSKVFKLKELQVRKDVNYSFEKKHKFISMSTKKLYFGEYYIGIQINGNIIKEEKFNLII